MKKIKRKRDIAVTIRMNDREHDELMNKVDESGLTQQSFVIRAIQGSVIRPSDEITVLKELSKTFADYEKQLRGLATNVNQLAHIANGQGYLPTEQQLANLSSQINEYRKESEKTWLLIRSSINQQKLTQQ